MEMFDEIIQTDPAGKPLISDEVQITELDMQEAVEDFIRSHRQFVSLEVTPASNVWWKHLEYLALADNSLKDRFCKRDRSKRTIALYHEYRMALVSGRKLRANA
jgi:hypothetical protein